MPDDRDSERHWEKKKKKSGSALSFRVREFKKVENMLVFCGHGKQG